MKYETLTQEQAEEVVARNRFLSWDGWDITTWRRDDKGFYDKRGAFRNGRWGILFRYALRNDGTYKVPVAYVNPR